MEKLQISRLDDDVRLPSRKHKTDAGIDLYAHIKKDYSGKITIPAFSHAIIPTGVKIKLPENVLAWITNKSKNNFLVGGGIVDPGYMGELLVKVFNTSNIPIVIEDGFPVAQLILLPIIVPEDVEEVVSDRLYDVVSDRGESGGILSQRDLK